MLHRIGPIALVFAALACALPLAAGLSARRTHDAWVQSLAERWRGELSLHTEQYSLGWLRSSAVVVVSPSGPHPASRHFRLEERIAHGPLLWPDLAAGRAPRLALAGVVLEWRPAPRSESDRALPGRPALQLSALVGFDRRVRLELESGPISRPDLEWSGASGRAELAEGEGSGTLESAGLRVAAGASSLDAGALRGEFRLRTSHTGLQLLDWSASLARLALRSPALACPGEASGILLGQSTEERAADLVDVVLRASMEQLRVDEQRSGPASIELAARNLDAVVLSVIAARLQHGKGGTAATAGRQFALVRGVPALLEREPALELTRLRVQTPKGVLDWSGRLWLEPLPPGEILGLPHLVSGLQAEAQLVTPVAALHALVDPQVAGARGLPEPAPTWSRESVEVAAARAALLEPWIRDGRLRREGDAYIAQLRLRAGRLTLNGVAIDAGRMGLERAPEPPGDTTPGWPGADLGLPPRPGGLMPQ